MQAQDEGMALLRKEIDQIDSALIQLFNQRMGLAHRIAAQKQQTDAPVFVPGREKENIARALEQVAAAHKQRAASLMSSLMRLSRSVQYEDLLAAGSTFPAGSQLKKTKPAWPDVQSIAVQGSTGSYSEQAGAALYPGTRQVFTATFAAACELVKAKDADVAVLPLENSTAGTVDDVYDLLLQNELYIWRSLSLPIRHCLLGLPGSSLADIKAVISHPQALAQCNLYTAARGWEVQEAKNTAFAAQAVSRGQDKSLAAIASPAAARAAGLVVLKDDISDTGVNQTRFIAVGRDLAVTPDAARVSLILRLPHTSGALAAVLAVFADQELNLSKIQSRPDRQKPWTYLFYLDFECGRQELPRALTALYQLASEMPQLQLLGWYGEVVNQSEKED